MRKTPPPMRHPSHTVCQTDRGRDNSRGRYYDERMPPYAEEQKAYRLDCCADGALTISERGQRPFNGAALPILFSDDLEKLKLVQATVGKLQWDPDPRLLDRPEKGDRIIFSWGIRTGTLAQLTRIGDVVWLVHEGRLEEAIALAWDYDRLAAQDDPDSYGAYYDDLESVKS